MEALLLAQNTPMDLHPPKSKRRMLGLAGAALWLVAIGTAFTALSLITIGGLVARLVLASVAIAAIIYLGSGIGVIRIILRSTGPAQPRTAEERVMLRRFVPVVIAEVVAIMIVNATCGITQHLEPIVSLDLLIVGIHFLPLAWIFRVPRYYATGGLFCLVSALTLVLVPAHAQVGSAAAWFVLPTFGCASVAWATAAFNLREAWQLVPKI